MIAFSRVAILFKTTNRSHCVELRLYNPVFSYNSLFSAPCVSFVVSHFILVEKLFLCLLRDISEILIFRFECEYNIQKLFYFIPVFSGFHIIHKSPPDICLIQNLLEVSIYFRPSHYIYPLDLFFIFNTKFIDSFSKKYCLLDSIWIFLLIQNENFTCTNQINFISEIISDSLLSLNSGVLLLAKLIL